jgi:hypothetical protein
MGVRGWNTVWTVMINSTAMSEASNEWVWFTTETFDTFGYKSMEEKIKVNQYKEGLLLPFSHKSTLEKITYSSSPPTNALPQ